MQYVTGIGDSFLISTKPGLKIHTHIQSAFTNLSCSAPDQQCEIAILLGGLSF